jgi:exoribonuclease R
MNYYNNFEKDKIILSECEYGILEKAENIFYVKNKEVINNRGIINDIVFIKENNVINIKERNNSIISGILYLNSNMKYGLRNKKPIYLFKPNNKNLPNFYVPSSSLKKSMVYCIIEFKSWEINEKQPFGNIIEIFGEIGIQENEYKNLLYYYNIFNKTAKFNKDKLLKHQEILFILEKEKKFDYSIFCIDPKGSKDLDDGFHYLKKKDFIEIGIHIAYPYKFLNEKEDLENIFKRVTTLYLELNNKNNIHLIPNIYSENLCSFIENNIRFSLSIILKIKNNEIIDYTIEEKIVYIEKNYSYDEFDNIYQKNNNINNFVNFTKLFFEVPEIDSHLLVEKWMIYANKIVAKYLISSSLKNIIVRVHQNKKKFICLENKNNNEKLINFLQYKQESSALYEIFNKEENIFLNQSHSKMENDYYTHFTSPIRRGIDYFNQSLLINNKDIYTNEELQEKINHINNYEKNVKKFYRKKSRLDFLFKNKNTEEILTYGYITELNENSICVYIPDYNLDEKIKLYNNKISKIIYIEIISDNKLQYIYENKTYIYNLYDKLDLKLFILLSEDNIFEKIKIQIC